MNVIWGFPDRLVVIFGKERYMVGPLWHDFPVASQPQTTTFIAGAEVSRSSGCPEVALPWVPCNHRN